MSGPRIELPSSRAELVAAQESLGRLRPPPWSPPSGPSRRRPPLPGAAFVVFGRGGAGPGRAGDPGWAAACSGPRESGPWIVRRGAAGAPYEPGLLLLREGPLLLAVLSALTVRPDVLILNATGRDHPRGAGVALHLGALLDIPSLGVTDRPLQATAEEPGLAAGAVADLTLAGSRVGHVLRCRAGARPLLVHAGWRTSPETALAVVRSLLGRARTPEPIRRARRLAREARAGRRPAPSV